MNNFAAKLLTDEYNSPLQRVYSFSIVTPFRISKEHLVKFNHNA